MNCTSTAHLVHLLHYPVEKGEVVFLPNAPTSKNSIYRPSYYFYLSTTGPTDHTSLVWQSVLSTSMNVIMGGGVCSPWGHRCTIHCIYSLLAYCSTCLLLYLHSVMNSSTKFIKSVQYTLGWWDLVNSPTLDRKPLSEEDVSLMIAAGSIYFIVSVESSQQELLSLGKPPPPL